MTRYLKVQKKMFEIKRTYFSEKNDFQRKMTVMALKRNLIQFQEF